MIYLVLDTNIWIYLANGFSTVSNSADYENDNHIEVFNQIKDKYDSNEFKILINEIVLKEWVRNKKTALDYIKGLKKYKGLEINALIEVKTSMSQKYFEKKCAEINRKFEERINKNKEHINNIDSFLNSLERIPISQEVKNEVLEMAINKDKAPFLNSKNNVADAIILFSSIDYLIKNMIDYTEQAVFVSGNYKEYGISKDKNEFHLDIKERIEELDISYHQNWGSLLVLAEDIQQEIDYFNELILDDNYFYCQMPSCDKPDGMHGFGYLDNQLRFTDSKETNDPNQLNLFPLPKPRVNNEQKVDCGYCLICSTMHIECPNCKNLVVDFNDNQIYCNTCETYYETGVSSINGDGIIYPITEEELHL